MNAFLKGALGRLPRFINIAAGLWLMAMPAVLNYAGTPAAAGDRIVGPFVVCFSTVALWEATRQVRLANLPFAAWSLAAPFFMSSYPAPAAIASCATGLLIAALSLVRGPVTLRFGGGWTMLWKKTTPDQRLDS